MIGAFYGLEKDTFTNTEDIWEGIFGFIASIIISIMGAGLLRVNKMREKWRVKLSRALEKKEKSTTMMGRLKDWSEKYVMFILPFVTVLREGLEAIVYVGLFSRAVWYLENNTWNHVIGGDASETGSGPGSYDIRQSVWHVNCCNPELGGGGGWGIFNALFGWTNSATYGSVLSYNLYWVVIIISYVCMRYNEKHGYIPVLTSMARKLKLDRFKKGPEDGRGSEVVEERKEVNHLAPQVITRTMSEA
ncbi:hypothetical protein APSETT445_005516 [Aspergillus pseudonomiae]